jgi:Flp pilus assembly protein TadD
VGEDAISRVISRLRKLSDGLGRDGWTLETITKVGYRLLPAGQTAEASAPTPASPRPGPSRRLLMAGGAGVAAAAAVAGGGVFLWREHNRPPQEAQVLVDKGTEALRQGLPQANAQAVGFFREAVTLAPDYADAWGALALGYNAMLLYTPPQRQAGVFTQAAAAARRALELDRNNPRGATALALLTPTFRNWRPADAQIVRAMDLSPGEPMLLLAYSRLLISVGRMREAVRVSQDAVRADSFAPFFRYVLAHALWGAGRIEEADLELSKALTRWPRHYALWFLQFHVWTHTGRADRAVALGEDLPSRPVGIPSPDVELSLNAARALVSRAPADIARVLETQRAAARRGSGYAENAMGWMCAFGEVDEAFAIARGLYFGEGFQIGAQRWSPDQGRFTVGRMPHVHPIFMPPTAAMRRDPRWPRLMSDLEITAYWRATGHQPDDPAWARSG